MITIKHDQVVEVSLVSISLSSFITNRGLQHLRPFSEKVRDLPVGWLIPIAILFVISFPPLFGHEIIALLCGVVYGLWIGFAIVAAGTFIGESKLPLKLPPNSAPRLGRLTTFQLARGLRSNTYSAAKLLNWNARISIMVLLHD
jgi:hypothetical protein